MITRTLPRAPRAIQNAAIALVAVASINAFTFAQSQTPARPIENKPAEIKTTDAKREPINLVKSVLVIGEIGKSARRPFNTDAINFSLATGAWKAPAAGDQVTSPDGQPRAWEQAIAAEDGTLRHNALRAGYALATFSSDTQRVMILSASAHSAVLVNAEPRMGDPYALGYAHLPVLIKKGDNEFLFSCGRGELRATLSDPINYISLDAADLLLPDLVIGADSPAMGAIIVSNNTESPLDGLQIEARFDGAVEFTELPSMLPVSTRKVAFRVPHATIKETGDQTLRVTLIGPAGKPAHHLDLKVSARRAGDRRRATYVSEIDGSVQYVALNPAASTDARSLILSLHGASVEGSGQAACYPTLDWAHVAAPTNRRPFGFDWEDWGMLDGLEALDASLAAFPAVDPARMHVTGHSMGGHGTWVFSTMFPGQFASAAPSAGWASFFSYAGAPRPEETAGPLSMLRRASNVYDTVARMNNLSTLGVYILHGDADDNVPVSEAREWRERLAKFHTDFAYYERPGAGHWWGNECVAWPQLLDFQKNRARPDTEKHVALALPSAWLFRGYAWLRAFDQQRVMELSTFSLDLDDKAHTLKGSAANVSRFTINARSLAGTTLSINIDSLKGDVAIPSGTGDQLIVLERAADAWKASIVDPKAAPAARPVGMKQALSNHVVLVYTTRGTPEENAWSLAKARFDAEQWWYRGNGQFDIVSDQVDPKTLAGRSVVLYGNADSNALWPSLMKDSPVTFNRGEIIVGARHASRDDLAAVVTRPNPLGGTVVAIGGTGIKGLRAITRWPLFVSGVGYPDLLIAGADSWLKGSEALLAAGYFAPDWSLDDTQIAWRE
ncbi:MAG: prolyl oligopeptidase family serine peptidase [Phycisphaerales bacterium]|nr:prolyl oligopeptidase family serine peptidase [Phycisphaerales bacterium]